MARVFHTTRLLSFFLLVTFFGACKKEVRDASPESISYYQNVIPKPDSVVVEGKAFALTKNIKIFVASDDLKPIGQYLADLLNKGTGYQIEVLSTEKEPESGIYLSS